MDTQFPAGLQAALEGQYELAQEIGRGVMATVYLALEVKHDRRVAVKVLHPALATTLGADRFLREIEIAARLQHPNILPLLDSGAADGALYYVMPYVEGGSLHHRLVGQTPLPTRDAIHIAREVASALKHAHEAGVVHLDVKPANILLSNGHAVLADFGIARAICDTCSDTLEAAGLITGTPGYMSPEQAVGEEEPDARSDIYGLACVLHEMLAGAPPFAAGSWREVIDRQLRGGVASVRDARPEVSSELDGFITQSLSADRSDRPQSLDRFLSVLSATALTNGATPTSTWRPSQPATRRPPVTRLGAAILLAAFVTSLAFAFGTAPTAPKGSDPTSATAIQSDRPAAATVPTDSAGSRPDNKAAMC